MKVSLLGIFIFIGLLVVGIGVAIFYKTKWNRKDKAQEKGRRKEMARDNKEQQIKEEEQRLKDEGKRK
jgi:hypothetical protein